jgi:hypothetical protein
MLTDPQSVTINAVAQSLPATSRQTNASTYTKDDGNVILSISHELGAKRNRRKIRLDQRKIAADPLISAQNIEYKLAIYVVIDEPVTGFTVVERQYLMSALTGWLTASSNANSIAVMGGQS